MENVAHLTTENNIWISLGLSLLTLILGLVIGLRFRQVICKTLQPVIHKYNIHHLVPVKEVKEDKTDSYYQSLEEKNKEVNKEEVKERSENDHQLAVEEVAEEVLEELNKKK